jgi:hypothetical protein
MYPDAVPRTAKAITAANLDVYEAAARAVSELEWLLARIAVYEPLRSLVQAYAATTRDTTAVQLSAARWVLDL